MKNEKKNNSTVQKSIQGENLKLTVEEEVSKEKQNIRDFDRAWEDDRL
jgi:hypothetical protein